MNQSSGTTFSDRPDIFSGLFENRTSKTLVILLTVFIDLINLTLSYGIVWYEHYGIDRRRTLMNKLVASIHWTAMVAVPLSQISELPRYFLGPQSIGFCFLQSVFKNSVKWQCLLLLDAVIFARYLKLTVLVYITTSRIFF
jgi:hypothetical protein